MARSFEPGEQRDQRIRQACKALGCTFTTLANDAVDIYLDILQEPIGTKKDENLAFNRTEEKPIPKGRLVIVEDKPTGQSQHTYYLHNSNPNIKLIDRITQNGQLYYIDLEGRKWLMAPDRTLIGVARIVS